MADVTLTLQASDGSQLSTTGENGDPVPVAVAEGARVTLTVSTPDAAALTDIAWTRRDKSLPMDEVTEGDGPHQISFEAKGPFFATYRATGKVGDTSATSPALTLRKKEQQPAEGPDDPPEETTAPVAEIEIGEYDPAFARTGFIVLGCATVALFALGLLWVSEVPLPGLTETVGEDEQAMGTFAERLVGRAVLIGTVAGLVLLLVGAYLAALETRGRLRAKVTLSGEHLEAEARGPAAEVAKELLEPAMKALQSMRGTVAVLAVGGLLLAGSLLLASSLLSGPTGSGSGTTDNDGTTQSPDTATSTSPGE